MKYTRSLITVAMTLFFMLAGALFQNMGQRLGWCQEQDLTAEQQACIDSGIDIDECLEGQAPGPQPALQQAPKPSQAAPQPKKPPVPRRAGDIKVHPNQ